MKKIKFLDFLYTLTVKCYLIISEIKQHLLVSTILYFVSLELVTNILCKSTVFAQVNFLSEILSYNQFWSLVDALVAIIVPVAIRNPRIRIEWISTMAANDKPYGIYNRSSFGYMIEILGTNGSSIYYFF